MIDVQHRKTFFNSVLCGVSFWSEECEYSSSGGENQHHHILLPLVSDKPKLKHKNKKKNVIVNGPPFKSGSRGLGLQMHHPRSVFPCNEEEEANDFLIDSSAVRRMYDAHLHLTNRHRLIYADKNSK